MALLPSLSAPLSSDRPADAPTYPATPSSLLFRFLLLSLSLLLHLLAYSLCCRLNTDLHNPAIKPKMTCAEFVRSTQSTVLRNTFSSMELSRIYRSIAAQALSICPANRTPRELHLKNLHVLPRAAAVARTTAARTRPRLSRATLLDVYQVRTPEFLLLVAASATAVLAVIAVIAARLWGVGMVSLSLAKI